MRGAVWGRETYRDSDKATTLGDGEKEAMIADERWMLELLYATHDLTDEELARCVQIRKRLDEIEGRRWMRKREKRIRKESQRLGTKRSHRGGWAARQAGKRRGR